MEDLDPQLKRLLLPDDETVFEQFIRYGLYVAAVFQMICLASLVFYTSGSSDGVTALKVISFFVIFTSDNFLPILKDERIIKLQGNLK